MPGFELLYQAAALCLTYPGDDFRARLPLLREAAPQLREFADHAAATPPGELAAHYLQVFESTEGNSLYLSHWRGISREHFQELYSSHGLELTGGELPDFLPAVLELAARTGNTDVLTEHRAELERLGSRLAGCGTPYASVVEAVHATLPAGPATG
ncbi:nitrate reductase molybdenum cofactor assembly chaperone [Streptomyces viridochromogenes]|nr:molecular chaperone TorD family protein [Streptomyces viridochromogenes]